MDVGTISILMAAARLLPHPATLCAAQGSSLAHFCGHPADTLLSGCLSCPMLPSVETPTLPIRQLPTQGLIRVDFHPKTEPACSWLLELATGCAAPNVGGLEKVLQRPGVQGIVVTRLTDFSFYLAEQWMPLPRVRLMFKFGIQTVDT